MKRYITEICEKEIINLRDGIRLGCPCDIEIEAETGRLTALIVSDRGKLLGDRGEQLRISWEHVQVIGDDTILVDIERPPEYKGKKQNNKLLSGLFREG
ncbi:MAG: YlmC/YmxH family sporulation protein [Ruminococcaceae bacterium]|nr:YlmC/YmxH family sporulation protein [Oscillospiraceae bacterium]